MAEKINEGDWVVNRATGNMGYVLDVLNYNIEVQFTMHRGKVRMVRPFKSMTDPEKLSLMPPEPNVFHEDILDIALLTKDIAWCEELQKLKGEKIDG